MSTHATRLRFALHDDASLDEVARALAGRLASLDPGGLLAAYAVAMEPGSVEALIVLADGPTTPDQDTILDALAAKLADRAELVERATSPTVDLLALIQDGSRNLG
ncbi:MAG: hypothetical protein M3Q03_20955 [Chloroflexota bacterium]|nr:hypothetical protein [Chloroflexota bacterium]